MSGLGDKKGLVSKCDGIDCWKIIEKISFVGIEIYSYFIETVFFVKPKHRCMIIVYGKSIVFKMSLNNVLANYKPLTYLHINTTS